MNAQHIQGVMISTDDNVRLTGSYTYDLMNLEAGFIPVATDNTDGSLTVNLTSQPLLSSTENLVFYAVVVPGKHSEKTLTCKVLCERVSLQFSAKIGCDFAAGSYYTLALNSATIAKAISNTIKVVVTPDPEAPAKPVYPGQGEETANCYMINTTGAHDFWATQIGNGAKGIIKGAGFHTEDPYINPQSAKLLWQDVQNFVSDITFNPQDGKVHYTANKTSGNAVIAVYDGPNGTGNVLWSWHIWGVGDKMPQIEMITNQAGATFEVMNRTLGTHSSTSYLATLYQWGRKDPFPNSSTYYLEDGSEVNIAEQFPSYKPVANDVSILTSIQMCDKLIDAFDWDKAPNWLCYENQKLWGDSSTRDHYTWWDSDRLSNPEAGAGWAEQKTIYDPSPVGYRVANKFTFSGFVKRDDGIAELKGMFNEGNIEEWLHVITEPRPGQEPGQYIYWWPKFNHGYYFMRNKDDKEGTYFPNAGQRYPSGNTPSAGVEGHYNYSAPNKNANLVDFMFIGEYEWRDKDNINGAGNHGNVAIQQHGDKYIARAVRCVKE